MVLAPVAGTFKIAKEPPVFRRIGQVEILKQVTSAGGLPFISVLLPYYIIRILFVHEAAWKRYPPEFELQASEAYAMVGFSVSSRSRVLFYEFDSIAIFCFIVCSQHYTLQQNYNVYK